MTELTQEEAFARIRLLRSPNIGPVSYAQLLRRFGDARSALAALPDLARRGGAPYRAAPEARIESEVASGEPGHVLVDLIENYSCEAVVLGATGMGNSGAALGSVAMALLQHSPVPVTVVRLRVPEEPAD